MNILISGNGLDLYAGLKTSYVDFVKYEKEHGCENPFIKHFINVLEKDGIVLEEYGNNEKEKRKYKWFDCEAEIYNVIQCFDDFIDSEEFLDGRVHLQPETKYQLVFNGFPNYFEYNNPSWPYTLQKSFMDARGVYDKDKLIEKIKDDFLELKKLLAEYLNIVCDENSVKNVYPFEKKFDCAVSFNYTKKIDGVHFKDLSIENIFHIHGDLCADNIVLGIDNIDDFENKEWIFATKNYQKHSKETDDIVYYKKIKDFRRMLKYDMNEINNYFFGVSFGKNDKNILLELLNNNIKDYQYFGTNFIYFLDDNDREDKVEAIIYLIGSKEFDKRVRDENIKFIPIQKQKNNSNQERNTN